MKLDNNLIQKNLFTLFTAPVAQGKTTSIIELYNNHTCKMIFISPLRALAIEVAEKFKFEKNAFWLGEIKNREEVCLNFLRKKRAVLICTVEILSDEFLELITAEDDPILFVIDEFHLFYTWGESFRPILHDKFLGILNTGHPTIGLSATINQTVMKNLLNDLDYYQPVWIHLNFGNLQLKNQPNQIHYFGGLDKRVMDRAFLREMKKKSPDKTYLLFCSTRNEVDRRMVWAKNQGYRALGCVGGEVEKFQIELSQASEGVDCIFSTVALSHGVNLPEIRKVFINYEVKDYDFWLQMVGRGGRRFGDYDIYTYDSYHLNRNIKWIKYFKSGLSDLIGIEF